MKKEEFMSFCKENKKKLAIGGTALLVVLGCGVGAYVMSNNDKPKDVPKTEYNQKVNYLDYVSGLRDWSVQKGTKKVNYLEGVTWSKEYINKVTVDDSKVDLNKEGTYGLIYKVDVKDVGMKDVTKKVKVTVLSKEEANKVAKDGKEVVTDDGIKNKVENKVDFDKVDKGNDSNKVENSKPSKNEDKPNPKPSKPAEKPSPKPSKPDGGSNSKPSKPSHTHKWEEQFKVVHHKEVGHYEKVKVKDAWVEEEPITEMQERAFCNNCGKDITDDIYGHEDKHLLDGNGKGWRTDWVEMQVGTNKINHPAEYKNKWVVDKPAWDEKVSNGFICSCGARK